MTEIAANILHLWIIQRYRKSKYKFEGLYVYVESGETLFSKSLL